MMDDGCDEVAGSTDFSILCRQGRQADRLFFVGESNSCSVEMNMLCALTGSRQQVFIRREEYSIYL